MPKLRKQFASNGEVVIALGANRPDEGITPMTLDYIARMAARINRRIVITTGTNHNKFTVNGNISDHFSGHAVDIGMIAGDDAWVHRGGRQRGHHASQGRRRVHPPEESRVAVAHGVRHDVAQRALDQVVKRRRLVRHGLVEQLLT